MNYSLYLWKLFASVAIFLLGMRFIEESLHHVAGRQFKLFLKRQTSKNRKALAGGAFVTGLLQSSSGVNSMVLAFVSTGVLTMQRGLAIILGDNLGTTVDSWFFASAGFSLNIGYLAYPFTGIAGIALMALNKNNKLYQWSQFLLGLGFLFLGLDFMKSGMMDVVKQIDPITAGNYSAPVFLLIGLLLTTLIQSSLATMAILLSALHANAITLYTATAIVLGSEIGTTLKFLLASVNGTAAKKQVALGNFLFNVIVSLLMLLLLQPLNYLITTIIGIRNSLTGLVFFQSFINLVGIILFYPFLNLFAKYLERLFIRSDKDTIFIHKIGTGETEYAIDAFQQETRYFLIYVIDFSLNIFKINSPTNKKNILSTKYKNDTLEGKYEFIKHVQGELHAYYVDAASTSSNKNDTLRLDKLISAVRNGMYAAKSMKDSFQDAEMLRNSSNESKYLFYLDTLGTLNAFYDKASLIMEQEASSVQFEKLASLFKEIQDGYTETLKKLYHHGFVKNLSDIEISSLINFNRQVYTAFKSMGLALKDFLIDEREAAYFDDLPGFIH